MEARYVAQRQNGQEYFVHFYIFMCLLYVSTESTANLFVTWQNWRTFSYDQPKTFALLFFITVNRGGIMTSRDISVFYTFLVTNRIR